MKNKIAIAERLLNARGNIPRAEVADAVHISISALAMYETGQRIPRDKIKIALSEFYKKSVQELFY